MNIEIFTKNLSIASVSMLEAIWVCSCSEHWGSRWFTAVEWQIEPLHLERCVHIQQILHAALTVLCQFIFIID